MKELFSRVRPQADPIELQPAEPITTTSTTPDMDIEHKNSNDSAKETSTDLQPRGSESQDLSDYYEDIIRKEAQPGVQKIEATTQVWSKKALTSSLHHVSET